MSENDQPMLADLKAEVARLETDVRELASLRWQLARMELEADLRLARRTAVVLAVAASMVVAVFPLAAFFAAELLDGRLGLPRVGWLAIFAAMLLVGGISLVWLAWRRFRRRFTGLRETLEEIQEDGVWLRQWIGSKTEE